MEARMVERRAGSWMGGVFVLIGIGIAVMVHTAPERATVPLFVLDAVAGVFACAGLSVLARGWGMETASRVVSLVMLYLFAVPGLWLFLGDDAGSCTITGSLSAEASPLLCRAFVGVGTVLVLITVVIFTVSFVRWLGRRRKTEP